MIFKKSFYLVLVLFCFISGVSKKYSIEQTNINTEDCYVYVLGIAQDAGHPQVNCQKDCCKKNLENQRVENYVSSIAIIDQKTKEYWIIDATPDFKYQLEYVRVELGKSFHLPDGILLTHAHTGHYTGLMEFSKEALNTYMMPVYAMPRMKHFIQNNGPWNQLVQEENIRLMDLYALETIAFNDRISVIPFLVPHRDEYSETVGFKIVGPKKQVLYIPDIDKWDRWHLNINEQLVHTDHAFLDATFYNGDEIGHRDIQMIPHPFVEETMERFHEESLFIKSKINFIHLNHTNPLLDKNSGIYKAVHERGYQVAHIGQKIKI